MAGRTSHLGISHRMVQEIIGPGAPDKKTQGLIDISAAAKKAGFIVPEYACITPAFFHRFLEDSGASKAKSHEEATKLIIAHNFTKQEKEALRAAAMLFKPHEHGHILVVRSGDEADGLGIWKGGLAYANVQDEKRLFEMVETTAKEILASDFSDDAIVYKGKKGISSNPGVIISPAYGECYGDSDSKIFMTPASVNFLGKQNGNGIYSYGPGLGGANMYDSPWIYGKSLSGLSSIDFMVQHAVTINMTHLGLGCQKVRENEYFMREAEAAFNSKLDTLMQNKAQGYREFALDSAPDEAWVITQAADAKIPALAKPSVDKKDVLASTSHIIGTACARTDKVYVSRYPGDERLIRFNAENKGYLLIVLTWNMGCNIEESGHARVFEDHYSLRHFSNAGAVLIQCWDIMMNVATHVGAAKRALGIPILARKTGEMDRDIEKWGFSTWQPTDAKCIVYANEFSERGPEGFIARA